MKKTNIIKKELRYPCYCCNPSIRGDSRQRKDCEVCSGTGFFKDEIYYHLAQDSLGRQIAVDSDNLS